MLDVLATGFLSFLLGTQSIPPLKTVDWGTWQQPEWLNAIQTPKGVNDPVAIASLQQHLNALTGLGMPSAAQGVWLQAGNQILAAHRGDQPIPAASLTKIATTLAALETWAPDFQFETLVGIRGALQDGVVQGDLIVQGGGDPLFVWEEAIALGNALNQAGIRRITGNLVVAGKFSMNFQADPATAGGWLKQGLDSARWTAEAARQHAALPAGTARPQVVIEGSVQVVPAPPAFTPVLRHRSLPLTQILKAMNIFSNNHIADSIAEDLGGGEAIARTAAAVAGIAPGEIRLINGSGLGEENQISPRAVVAMLTTLQHRLAAHQLNVADFFPVVGRERGTLGARKITPGAAFKTGTLDRVSSLAGVVPTRDRGLVWFSIFDIGTGDLKTLHRLQDDLLQRLVAEWGTAPTLPPEIAPSDRLPTYQSALGDPRRNEPIP